MKLNDQKLKITPKKIIEMSTMNMNIQPSKKYGFSPQEVEKRALESKKFRTVYNMLRLKKMHKLSQRQDRYNKKKYSGKRKKLRDNLYIGERVYVLAERIRKKSAPGKFYKQLVQNVNYFRKDAVFVTRKKKNISNITYYWMRDTKNNKNMTKRFLRSEIFALKSNFM